MTTRDELIEAGLINPASDDAMRTRFRNIAGAAVFRTDDTTRAQVRAALTKRRNRFAERIAAERALEREAVHEQDPTIEGMLRRKYGAQHD
ncbi:MAG: hypothetical protein JW940_02655 [Polyangiaceae bacterium]|nr:hypothetical protein [Polyangiaceae bacterium]